MGLFLDQNDNPKWGCIIGGLIAAAFIVPVGCSVINTTASVTTAPGRVAQETLRTSNILDNYEWFYNTNANYEARKGQIVEYKGLLSNEADPAERTHLRIELSAMRMSCRELATTYNANSQKLNRSLFKANNLPAELSKEECDA